jgi:hypothetical protein
LPTAKITHALDAGARDLVGIDRLDAMPGLRRPAIRDALRHDAVDQVDRNREADTRGPRPDGDLIAVVTPTGARRCRAAGRPSCRG